MYKYNAIIKGVIDASLIEATLDLGFGVTIKRVFRIRGLNITDEKALALKPKAIEILTGKHVVIEPTKIGRHGRYEAAVFIIDLDKDYLEIIKPLC